MKQLSPPPGRAPALPGVRTELAAAIRRVNCAYNEVPEERWPEVDREQWATLESEIDAAMEVGDEARALTAIKVWEDHAVTHLREAIWV